VASEKLGTVGPTATSASSGPGTRPTSTRPSASASAVSLDPAARCRDHAADESNDAAHDGGRETELDDSKLIDALVRSERASASGTAYGNAMVTGALGREVSVLVGGDRRGVGRTRVCILGRIGLVWSDTLVPRQGRPMNHTAGETDAKIGCG